MVQHAQSCTKAPGCRLRTASQLRSMAVGNGAHPVFRSPDDAISRSAGLPDLIHPSLLRLNRRFDCLIHLSVTGATAEISAQRVADILFCWVGIPIEQCLHRNHKTGGTVTALRPAPIAIRLLDCR